MWYLIRWYRVQFECFTCLIPYRRSIIWSRGTACFVQQRKNKEDVYMYALFQHSLKLSWGMSNALNFRTLKQSRYLNTKNMLTCTSSIKMLRNSKNSTVPMWRRASDSSFSYINVWFSCSICRRRGPIGIKESVLWFLSQEEQSE